MKKVLLVLMLMVVFNVNAQELRTVLSQAMEHYNSGNCADALPLFENILNSNLPPLRDNSTLNYKLNYYAGFCARSLEDYDKSYKYLYKALSLAKKGESETQVSVLHALLGDVSKEQGDYRRAQLHYESALLDVPKNSPEAASLLYFLAETQRAAKSYSESIESCTKSLKISEQNKGLRLEVACLTSMGEAYNEQSDYPQAIKMFNHSLTKAQQGQLAAEMANNHTGLAIVYEKLGKYDVAKQNYDEALRLYAASGSILNIPLIANHLIALPKVDRSVALKSVDQYVMYIENLLVDADEQTLLDMNILVGYYYYLSDNYVKSIATLNSVVDIATEGDYAQEAAKGALMLADVYYIAGQYSSALETMTLAQHHHSQLKPPTYLASLYAKQGEILNNIGRKLLAKSSYQKAISTAIDQAEAAAYLEQMNAIE